MASLYEMVLNRVLHDTRKLDVDEEWAKLAEWEKDMKAQEMINALSQYRLLQLISEALEEKKRKR